MKSAIRIFLLALAACGAVGESGSGENDPTIASVAPDHGPTSGGVTVTLTGTGFSAGEPYVLVGGVLAANAVATSDTQLTFELPAGEENELVEITVGNSNGFGTKTEAFRYNARPIILSVSPQVGRFAGGTPITITGRGFQELEAGIPTIRIGGGVATDVQIVDDTTLTAITGAVNGEVKPFTKVDVEVQNTNGSVVMDEAFTITAPGLLAVQRGASRVHFVDKITGEVTFLSRIPHRMGSCATQGGVLYGVGRGAASNHELFTFDAVTGTATVIGPLVEANMAPHGTSAIAFVGTKLYGLDNTGSARTNRLMEINPTTGVVTMLGGALPVTNSSGLVARDASSLFYASTSTGQLSIVTTAGGFSGGNTFTGGSGSQVPSLANTGGTLYLTEKDTARIFTVNPATAALTLLANLSFQPTGMCETPSTF